IPTMGSAEGLKESGNNLYKNGDYEGAIKMYNAALLQDIRDSTLYTNRAMCHLKLSKYDDVLLDCEMAL
ncbi:hypothetical protein CANCADRAFT_16729, partial [Tortispora caseinolytica NRRL Y-17796]